MNEPHYRPGRWLAFFVRVRNNLFVTRMRLACGLVIALCLSLPVPAMAFSPQEPPTTRAAGQASPAQAPAAQVPDSQPASMENRPEAATKKSDGTGVAKGNARHRKHIAQAPNNGPRRVVVREGGANEPAAQIIPDLTPAEAARQRQNTEHWLGSTGDQLKQLAGRTLNGQQQQTLEQIRNYMGGAQSALLEGDVQRASTLAEKAHLLIEDLVKH